MQIESYHQTSEFHLSFGSCNPAEHSVWLDGGNYESCSFKHGNIAEQAGIWASKGEGDLSKFIFLTSVCFPFGRALPHVFKRGVTSQLSSLFRAVLHRESSCPHAEGSAQRVLPACHPGRHPELQRQAENLLQPGGYPGAPW